MELYNVEQSVSLTGSMDDRIKKLIDEKYLKASETKAQTDKAVWVLDPTVGVKVNINGCSAEVKTAANQLNEHEKAYIIQ
jgi:hypothetical protein